jgi:hypothetical protein
MDLLSMVGDKLGTSYAAALAHNEEVGKKERMNDGCPHCTLVLACETTSIFLWLCRLDKTWLG